MADITRKRTGELLRSLFDILKIHPDGIKASEALLKLSNTVTLSEYENGFYESGTRRFDKIVRFATVDCVKAGWMVKNKGFWSVTPEGLTAYNTFNVPEEFYREAVRLYRIWKQSSPATPSKETPSDITSPEEIDQDTNVTFEQAEEQSWTEIEQYLGAMNPYDFQDLVADLLEGMGYFISWVAPPGKDGGVDIIAYSDPLGTIAPRIKVQVKRQQEKIKLDGLKSFVAIVNEDDVGIFVSIGGFTKDAEEYARFQERRKITLISLEKLVDLWIANYGKLSEAAKRRMPLTPIYFLTPKK